MFGVDVLDGDADVQLTAAAADDDDDDDDDDALLAHLGVHTVDELIDSGGRGVDSNLRLHYDSEVDSSCVTSPAPAAAPLRSILSITPRSLTPKSSRSRVRLMDGLTEVRSRSRSPSPVSTLRSASPVSTAMSRSHSVTSVIDEVLTGHSMTSVHSDSSEHISTGTASDVTARAVTDTETDHQPRRYRSRRRLSEPLSMSLYHRSGGERSRQMSETAAMTYSEDFTPLRTSVDYSELTSSISDETVRRKRHNKHRCVCDYVIHVTCNSHRYNTRHDTGV